GGPPPRPPVPPPPAVYPGGRELPASTREHLLAGQDARGAHGSAVLPLGSAAEDGRAAVLERHDAGRLCGFRPVPAGSHAPEVEPVELPRRSRRCSGS